MTKITNDSLTSFAISNDNVEHSISHPYRMYIEIKMTKLVKVRLITKTPFKFEIILILFSTMVYYFRFFIIPNIICYFDFRFFPSISIVKVVFK